MVPLRNPKKFVDKYGELYYLREFDYLPSPLKYYNQNISTEFMKYAYLRHFDLFTSREEAADVSYKLRKERGIENPLQAYAYDTDLYNRKMLEKLKE